MSWKVRSIRGATTCFDNTEDEIRNSVNELLKAIEANNPGLDFTEIIHVTFSVTKDLDQIFPAAIAREHSNWADIPLLDVQHMHVKGGLEMCIRCLIQFNMAEPGHPINHVYLRGAKDLRPDLCLPEPVTL